VVDSLLSVTASERPQHVALAYGGATLTFAELAAASDRLLKALDVEPGERVAVVAPNVPALVVCMLAIWRAGAVVAPLSARLRRFELERAFADAEPTAAVSVSAHHGFPLGREVQAVARDHSTMRAFVVVDELGAVVDVERSGAARVAAPSGAELAAILYTSGTTGEPKGALLPHRLAEAIARNLAGLLGPDADAPYALAVPASHAFGLDCLISGIAAGATAVLVDMGTSIDPLIRALSRHDAPVLHGTPPLFRRLLRTGAQLRVRTGFVAGSRCPPELLAALDQRGARILNLYGMTEIGAGASCRADDPAQTRYRTVGRALRGYELRVAPGAEPAAAGEIQVRSPYLPSGYHARPWGGEELTDDGWFRTGDLGEFDAAGNLMIAGRAKDVVHVGGFNVFPAEVEAFLLTHPAIAQAAVIGVPHPALGEALQAFVVPAEDAGLEPREVINFARAGIAGYKVPYTVHVEDELPLLPSGKPDRRALAGVAAAEEVAR